MSLDEDNLEKLTKFLIVKGTSIISIIYRESKEFIYNFFHPMSRVEKAALDEAVKINVGLDLFYSDIKLLKLSDGSELIFYEGNKARLMTIFKQGTINDETSVLIERILERFLGEFEDEYSKQLKDWNGDTTIFEKANKMLFDFLNVDLTYPHLAKYVGFNSDDPLENYIFEAADQFTRKIGYFYLDNLIFLTKEHVLDKAREEGKNLDFVDFPSDKDFYLAMFRLKKKGMLLKIDNFIEDLNLFSKIQYN